MHGGIVVESGLYRKEPKIIQILLVDGHWLLRKMLKEQIDLELDMHVVGEDDTEFSILEKAQTLLPDVILIDLDIPGSNGMEITRKLMATVPLIPVILLSLSHNDALRKMALQMGAVDLIAKETDPKVLLNAIRRAAGRG